MSVYRKTILLLALMCATQVVHAIPIVPDSGGGLGYDGTSHAWRGPSDFVAFDCGAVGLRASPTPEVSVNASGCEHGVSAGFIYYFGISGPPGSVPVGVAGFSEAGVSSNSLASYSLTVNDHWVVNALCGDDTGIEDDCRFKGYSDVLSLETNKIYEVQMFVNVYKPYGIGGGITGYALLDPFFFIDPNFANSSAYSFAFSGGVGNNPYGGPVVEPVGVPAPSTLALLGLGLLGAPLVRRRGRYISKETRT